MYIYIYICIYDSRGKRFSEIQTKLKRAYVNMCVCNRSRQRTKHNHQTLSSDQGGWGAFNKSKGCQKKKKRRKEKEKCFSLLR